MMEIIQENPDKMIRECKKIKLPDQHDIKNNDVDLNRLGSVMHMAYNNGINYFDDLIMLKGTGPKTLKSLALVSEGIHGDSSRFEDPSRFAFAVGGKDGVPHPVDTKTYDKTIDMLQDSVEKSKLGYNDKSKALRRLHRATVKNEKGYTPTAFLEDILDLEWNHAEKNSGMTIMGETIKGVTRAIVSIQNKVLYGSNESKD